MRHHCIQQEIAALRRIARPIVPEAFGPAFPHRVHALRGANHLFSLMPVGDGLELTIDTYSALRRPTASEFDGVRYETMVIAFETARACRASYHDLHRLARAILSGLRVIAGGQAHRAAARRYRITITMPDGSTGRHEDTYTDAVVAAQRAKSLFPDASCIQVEAA